MPNDMTLILGGELIPAPSRFKRVYQPNETDNQTLGGNLYTDFINVRRVWEISWKLLTYEDFATLNELFLRQYREGVYHTLQFDVYGILAPVKMEVSTQDIRYNGVLVEEFSMILKEQYAIS